MDNPVKTESPNAGEKRVRNPFAAFLHKVFVHNIGFKVLAIVMSAAIFLLTVGLN